MTESLFSYAPDPDYPGWHRWDTVEPGLFNDFFGVKLCRPAGDNRAEVRFFPTPAHRNILNGIHGGALLAYVDICLFGAGRALAIENIEGSTTVELSTQFMSPGRAGLPLDAEVELLRETGRLLFLRGLFRQESRTVLSFSAIVRKASRPPAIPA